MKEHILLIVFISLSVLSINPVNARTNNDQQIIYLPIIAGGNQPIPDPRFGINNLSANDVNALGFTGDRYIQQWNADYLNEKITAHVLLPANHNSSYLWCLSTYRIAGHPNYCSTDSSSIFVNEDGWVNEREFKQYVFSHPGEIWIIGNEPYIGDQRSHHLSPNEMARWYRAARSFIKDIDPTALVSQYGMMVWEVSREFTLQFWAEYKAMYGEILPTDFIPFHLYGEPGEWTIENQIKWYVSITQWLDKYRGIKWDGERDYRLTEFGLRIWSAPANEEETLMFMEQTISWLKNNQSGITEWAWWSVSSKEWEEHTKLIENGKPTKLGVLYYQLAVER